MNSKEALDQLIDEIKYTHNDGKTLTNYDAKLVKVIKKDLEVLEIIKNKLLYVKDTCGNTLNKDNKVICLYNNYFLSNKEYKLLKEWWAK